MFLKTKLGYYSRIAIKNMQLPSTNFDLQWFGLIITMIWHDIKRLFIISTDVFPFGKLLFTSSLHNHFKATMIMLLERKKNVYHFGGHNPREAYQIHSLHCQYICNIRKNLTASSSLEPKKKLVNAKQNAGQQCFSVQRGLENGHSFFCLMICCYTKFMSNV